MHIIQNKYTSKLCCAIMFGPSKKTYVGSFRFKEPGIFCEGLRWGQLTPWSLFKAVLQEIGLETFCGGVIPIVLLRGLHSEDWTLYGGTTICPRRIDPFYIVTQYIKWVTTSWTHSMLEPEIDQIFFYISDLNTFGHGAEVSFYFHRS